MNKLNERLTLIANLSVVVGIIFLAVGLQQNTRAVQAQTRDSMTEMQMMFTDWIGTNRDAADVFLRGQSVGLAGLEGADLQMFRFLVAGIVREWENSHYQYERGLFTPEEYEARVARWRQSMSGPGFLDYWQGQRHTFAPSFRAEIDRIVPEVGG